MHRAAFLLIISATMASSQPAKNSPEFEVASIKPAPPRTTDRMMIGMGGGPGTSDPGRMTFTSVTLKMLLTRAYNVKNFQITGPAWLDSERFEIMAKVPVGATKEDSLVMIQNLLAERFKLVLHREQKEMPVYALVVGKNGPKMKESEPDDAADASLPPPPGGRGVGFAGGRPQMGPDGFPVGPGGRGGNYMMMMNGKAKIAASKQTIQSLADMLSNQLSRPVLDQTGLKGKYDYTLYFTPEQGMGMPVRVPVGPGGGAEGVGPAPAASDDGGPNLFAAIQEQLGLKLESKKGAVEILVIDSGEKTPTEN